MGSNEVFPSEVMRPQTDGALREFLAQQDVPSVQANAETVQLAIGEFEDEELDAEESQGPGSVSAASIAVSGGTTLMVRNIPGRYTQDMLLEAWPNNGSYDFLYLPQDWVSPPKHLNYAFINFTTEDHALTFFARWHRKRLGEYRSRKALNIRFADVQGRERNILRLKNGRFRNPQSRAVEPIIFDGEKKVSFVDAVAELEEKRLERAIQQCHVFSL